MFGFSPESWIAKFIDAPPGWLVHDLTRVALVLIAVIVIVGVFLWDRSIRRKTKDVASIIKMTVGEDGPYFDTTGNMYSIRRTFNLRLENVDPSKPVSNCSTKILSVTPDPGYTGPWLLNDGLSLAAGEHEFVPLVTYGEAMDPIKYDSADSFMTMGTADDYPLLDIGEKYTVTIRATAPETAPCDFQCGVWVDDAGRLRIEEGR